MYGYFLELHNIYTGIYIPVYIYHYLFRFAYVHYKKHALPDLYRFKSFPEWITIFLPNETFIISIFPLEIQVFCSIVFYPLGAGPSVPYWDFRGSTFISSSYIRLTPDHQSKQGGLWNSVVGISRHVVFDTVTC